MLILLTPCANTMQSNYLDFTPTEANCLVSSVTPSLRTVLDSVAPLGGEKKNKKLRGDCLVTPWYQSQMACIKADNMRVWKETVLHSFRRSSFGLLLYVKALCKTKPSLRCSKFHFLCKYEVSSPCWCKHGVPQGFELVPIYFYIMHPSILLENIQTF